MDGNVIYNLFEEESKIKVSFGTTQDRKMAPEEYPPDRLGNEMAIVQDPNLGPGRYENEEKTRLVYQLNNKVGSNCKGGGFGITTADRLPKTMTTDQTTPYPGHYQGPVVNVKKVRPAFRPFNKGAPRTTLEAINDTPGAGTYEHETRVVPKVKTAGSFGGEQKPVLPPLKSDFYHKLEDPQKQRFRRRLSYLDLYY